MDKEQQEKIEKLKEASEQFERALGDIDGLLDVEVETLDVSTVDSPNNYRYKVHIESTCKII